MIRSLKRISEDYKLNIKGVLHIGAYDGSEYHLYKKLGIRDMIFFEPCLSNFTRLKKKLGNKTKKSLLRRIAGKFLNKNFEKEVLLVKKALGNDNQKISINIETENGGASNSILAPKLHLEEYPEIKFDQKEEVDMIKLDDFLQDVKKDYNFLAIDVQGYELEVLKGAKESLEKIDAIISEVNNEETYANCVLIDELDAFLLEQNFVRREVMWNSVGFWGDALYTKKTT